MVEISYINLCGFRGYTEPTRIEFSSGFNVISGRNGVGKSTLCDAVEYALTGALNKYRGAKSSGESVENYIWWRGATNVDDYFVEVGFVDDTGETYSIKRTRGGKEPSILNDLISLMCDKETSPPAPLVQLSKTSIIRDEFISSLSLDLKETERFQLLRDALGTPDSDVEIERANQLRILCTKKVQVIDDKREEARKAYKDTTTRIEQLRARISEDSAIKEATKFLQEYLALNLPADSLIPTGRNAISSKREIIETLEKLKIELANQAGNQKVLVDLRQKQETIEKQIADLDEKIEAASQAYTEFIENQQLLKPEEHTRMLSELLEIGRELGLVEDHCPLCNAPHTTNTFSAGIDKVGQRLHKLNAEAENAAKQKAQIESNIRNLRESKEKTQEDLNKTREQAARLERSLSTLDSLRTRLKYEHTVSETEIEERLSVEKGALVKAESALRVLETLSFNSLLESSIRERKESDAHVRELEGLLARARRAEFRARSLHDATRRAANEALDDRLDLIGPLLGDLYRRLRPHTSWRDIDYRIRGDVKRFLSLEVGDGLNPQFIFSSGQRRATGLAFLLSVYLATSWSNFRTLILDDPVQHIDDFRAVHLAEVLALLHGAGHQIICAVEDPALANLLCRRLPYSYDSEGLHIKLGENERGVLSVLEKTIITSSGTSILQ